MLLWIENMLYYSYVYSRRPTCLIEFWCDFHFTLVYTFEFVIFEQFWVCKG